LLPHGTYFIRQFLVFVLFIGYYLARLCVFWTAMSIRKVFFVFLSMNVISGQLKDIVLLLLLLLHADIQKYTLILVTALRHKFLLFRNIYSLLLWLIQVRSKK
jgi:hypothetical protein